MLMSWWPRPNAMRSSCGSWTWPPPERGWLWFQFRRSSCCVCWFRSRIHHQPTSCWRQQGGRVYPGSVPIPVPVQRFPRAWLFRQKARLSSMTCELWRTDMDLDSYGSRWQECHDSLFPFYHHSIIKLLIGHYQPLVHHGCELSFVH